ncbi:major facilitator superfamily protein [Sarocladium implicatum]|nr:major facilitator superfamily protein [Sarocladium implicatum]
MSTPESAPSRLRFRLGRNRNREKDEVLHSHSKWSMGVLNDPETVEVPGSVLLLAAHRNEPLGLRNVHARTSHSSIPAGFHVVEGPPTPGGTRPEVTVPSPGSTAHDTATLPAAPSEDAEKKKTPEGDIILDPQPEDSANDPLNWPGWRRDTALLSLGFYCMVGGGITPLIAAGFTEVSEEFDVDKETVALTTGLYMMGLGLGSVVASPTAILFGKRPVYLVSAIIFIVTSIWCASSPSFESLLAARVFQGMAVSPVECLPSATIAEIFFLHERAYRIGIYTLLLLGGKNLVPLVSAAVIGAFGWRWPFWIVAMIGGLGFGLLFLFVPETFWDRTPTRKPSKRPSFLRRLSSRQGAAKHMPQATGGASAAELDHGVQSPTRSRGRHVGWAGDVDGAEGTAASSRRGSHPPHTGGADSNIRVPEAAHHQHTETHDVEKQAQAAPDANTLGAHEGTHASSGDASSVPIIQHPVSTQPLPSSHASPRHSADLGPDMRAINSPYAAHTPQNDSSGNVGYFSNGFNLDNEKISASALRGPPKVQAYTHNLRHQPARSFVQQLKPYHGRLNNDKWLKVMIRPFILFAYPAVLWSSLIYACSIGWLIVISETLAILYRNPELYNFTALQTGLTYISPFIGGILGTGVAGRISDVIVRAMSRRNGGLYEPEFRLVMAIPITITTCIGLMGFGWSIDEKDHWMVPTTFFGIISFGCSLGSTTSITFCVDSYRQYAGEALVTLNFAKNIFHGLVFSLFVTHWLANDGPKMVYIWIGVIQLIVCLLSIPMYIYGKRMRMWTVRKNLMERF